MTEHTHDEQALREEALEELWVAAEDGRGLDPAELAERAGARVDADWEHVTARLEADGLLRADGCTLRLTSAGRGAAERVIRRHRLAEVLLTEVLDVAPASVESDACRMEHALSDTATEAVCAFLGHPPVCPHGRPIPRGACCARRGQEVRPLLQRLAELRPGEAATVVLVAPSEGEGLAQLTDLGVIPGARVILRQHKPSLVVEVDRTLLAVEPAIARRIHVRRTTAA